MKERFEDLRKLSEAAIPGEWSALGGDSVYIEAIHDGKRQSVNGLISLDGGIYDAAFVCAAVNFVRELLAGTNCAGCGYAGPRWNRTCGYCDKREFLDES